MRMSLPNAGSRPVHRWAAVIPLLILSAFFAMSDRCLSADEKRKDPQPHVTLTGTDSRVTEPGCFLIRSEAEWIKTWQRHKAAKESPDYDLFYNPLGLPAVDFGQCMIVAVFQGVTVNNAGLRAVSLVEEKGRVVLRFENKTYQTLETARPAIPAGGVLTVRMKAEAVHGFFVIPRTGKGVVVEEGVRQLLTEPVKFKERAAFPSRVDPD